MATLSANVSDAAASDAAFGWNPILEFREDNVIQAKPMSQTLLSTARTVRSSEALFDLVYQTCVTQAERAMTSGVGPNTNVPGDTTVRRTIPVLLSQLDQRRLFVALSSGIERSRIRSLFGSPPYCFLLPGDAALLSAAGFTPSRTNMAYDTVSCIPNAHQFGGAVCRDHVGREFRMYEFDNTAGSGGQTLFGFEKIVSALSNSERVELVCRVPRKKAAGRGETVRMPQKGDQLLLVDVQKGRRTTGLVHWREVAVQNVRMATVKSATSIVEVM